MISRWPGRDRNGRSAGDPVRVPGRGAPDDSLARNLSAFNGPLNACQDACPVGVGFEPLGESLAFPVHRGIRAEADGWSPMRS